MHALGNQNVLAITNMATDKISITNCLISFGDGEVLSIFATIHGLCSWPYSLFPVMYNVRSPPLSINKVQNVSRIEPRYNEPLYDEVIGIKNPNNIVKPLHIGHLLWRGGRYGEEGVK